MAFDMNVISFAQNTLRIVTNWRFHPLASGAWRVSISLHACRAVCIHLWDNRSVYRGFGHITQELWDRSELGNGGICL